MSKQISKTVLATILREDKLIFAEMEVKENKRLIKAEFEIMPPKESILEKILVEIKQINTRIDGTNARIDEVNARIDDLSNDFNNRFDKLETRVEALDKRVTVLEEKAK